MTRFAAAALLLTCAAPTFAADYFVAPAGSDTNSGTLDKPFATVTRAQAAANPGDTVYLRGGTYKVTAEQGHGQFVAREANNPVNRALSTWKEVTAPRKIELDYRPLEGDATLSVDRLKLQHIIGHLIANAIKFSHAGGRVIIEAAMNDKGELLPKFQPSPMVASFMRPDGEGADDERNAIPVPKGPVEVW